MIRISGRFTQLLTHWLNNQNIVDIELNHRLHVASARSDITIDEWQDLLLSAKKYAFTDYFGLEIGASITLKNAGVLGYLILHCENLNEALTTYQLCERRFYGVNFCQLTTENNKIKLSWPNILGDNNGLFVQVAFSSFITFLRQCFPHTLKLTEVCLCEEASAAAQNDSNPYNCFFGCNVTFNALSPSISLDYEAACQPENGSIPLILEEMREQAVNDFIPSKSPFLFTLQKALVSYLPHGKTSLQEMSNKLNTSPRTLQRRLGEYNLSYQQVLDGLRENLSYRYLQQNKFTQVETAMLLGFSEQSAFNRAFKKWTGTPPKAYLLLNDMTI